MSPTQAQLAELERLARQASNNSYSPYSRFAVGAAVLAGDGGMFTGCNVESASYGLTVCAERSAVCQAVAGGCREILAVVIYTPTPSPTPPCGACRQFLYEFGRQALVISVCDSDSRLEVPLARLLPDGFGPPPACGTKEERKP